MLAQLYSTYPGRDWVSEPISLVRAMLLARPAILAEQEARLARAARIAWAKQNDVKAYFRQLQMAMTTYEPDEPAAVIPASDKAADWFRRNEIRVIEG